MRFLAIFAGAALDVWLANQLDPSWNAWLLGTSGGMAAAFGLFHWAFVMTREADAGWEAYDAIERAYRASKSHGPRT